MKKTRYLLLWLYITACIALVGGCVLPGGGARTPAQQNSAPVQSGTAAYPSFSGIVQTVENSVVAITTESVVNVRRNQPRTVQGAGSGWIMDGNGTIVTNNHVIEGAKTITVTLGDGRSVPAKIVKADSAADLAVIKVSAGKLNALTIGDSTRLLVGDWVLAVGNPLGMGISAKQGIVSRLGVSIEVAPGQTYTNLIETSAAINPGNSGGPLVNLAGEIVGITSLKLSTSGVEGMGYAINIKDAMPVIQRLAAGS